MANHWLFKTEPSVYSFQQLQKDKKTIWDGVANNLALKNLKDIEKGDLILIYHTGDERQAVGTASVLAVDAIDPKQPIVKIKAGEPLKKPVTLTEIKANKLFKDSPLLKIGRLSVVPLTEAQYNAIVG